MDQEDAIWKRYTYQQLLGFTDQAFDNMWLTYTREMPENERARLMEIAKLERLHKKIELLLDKLAKAKLN